jgi:anti-sigma factor RsiW
VQVFKKFIVKPINSQYMSCKDYQKQIISYLDGELHQDLADMLNQHITECKSCSKTFATLKNVYATVESEKAEFKVDAFMSARVLAKIKNRETSYSTSRISLRYLTLVGLAAAGIAFGILIGTLYNSNSSVQTTTSIQEGDQLAEEYMPEIENNPYDLIANTNETPTKP